MPGIVTVSQGFNNSNEPFLAQAINLVVQPINGYSNTVTLSCSVSPPLNGGGCTLNPLSSGPGGSG